MDGKYLELPTKTLLSKFGEGNDVPGSGSAAALQGLLSAQMILNVIKITQENNIKNYQRNSVKFDKISNDLGNKIIPELETLFEEDSKTFSEVIRLRKLRDAHKQTPLKRDYYEALAIEALKEPTSINFQMASVFENLAECGIFICDTAYPAVAGESSITLNLAISALRGTISIINLNFKSLAGTVYYNDHIDLLTKTKIKISEYIEEESRIAINLESKTKKKNDFKNNLNDFLSVDYENRSLSDVEIENIVRSWQNLLWLNRGVIWKQRSINQHNEILDPLKSIKSVLGFKVDPSDSLGQINRKGKLLEVAAEINSPIKCLSYSTQFLPETINFTLAHELGHAILHKNSVLHRDIPINNSELFTSSDYRERQANKFAAFFLMPRNLVTHYFQQEFRLSQFTITQDNLFHLNEGDNTTSAFKNKYKNLRDLSRLIARTERFAGNSFTSISKIFRVSQEAMAIRLEELDLVKY